MAAVTDSAPLVLGIETSCDETGIALVRGHELLADVTATSMSEHARFGGIVPEVASRAHLEAFGPTLDEALRRAGVTAGDVDAVAVTSGPGLVGSLTVGVGAAKSLALALGVPLYGVNHILGHAAVDALVDGPFPAQWLALVVSGGHSSLLRVRDSATDVVELGQTLDDAAGEAFAKVGRLLGLPHPGGPHVDKLAQTGDAQAFAFPRRLTPESAMVRSAGQSSVAHGEDIGTDVVELGQTLEDAAGESFGNVGRLLGLPYPGGPQRDKLAQTGAAQAFAFPRGLSRSKDMA